MSPTDEITRLVERAQAGDAACVDELFRIAYAELRRMAQHHMGSERAGHTLQATALVHEAFVRLVGENAALSASADVTRYFFAAAGEAMRRILVEHARARARLKRGGDGQHAPPQSPISVLDTATQNAEDSDILSLDAALARLEQEDAAAAQVVRLRYFAGLSGEETARALGVSPSTVDRNWAFARARLFGLMQEGLSG